MKYEILAAASILLAFSVAAPAAQSGAAPIISAEKLTLRSTILAEERILNVAKPAGYDQSQAAYPVLYVLDGGINFPFTAEVVRFLSSYRLIPEMIVVGVDNTDRGRDMTPNKPVPAHDRYKNAGGADRFIRFLAEEAVPAVEKRYRAHPERALAGHSLSGLLVIHALLSRPEAFSSYIAISPSLWWNGFEYLAKVQDFYKNRASLAKKLFVSLADESSSEPDVYARVQAAFEKSRPRDLIVWVRFFKEENHITTAVVSTTGALMKLFGSDPRVPPGK